jgi:cellulose synthase/poly-beta-1,6-N-acetylglucosamine synthase-like glycosyltransferase
VNDSLKLRRIEYLLGTLLGLVVADGLISQFLIKSGIGQEGNPLLKTIVAEGNFLIVKMCGAVVCVLILWNMAKRVPRLVFIVSVSLVAVYTAILFWNLAVFFIYGT